jgi:hypothetical protein
MATANPKEARAGSKATILYVYRGNGHEHPVDAENVIHLGGNITSNPKRTNIDSSSYFELDNMISELEDWSALNKNAQKCFKHYVISISNKDFGKVSNSDWLILANQYMQALGFGNDTKWTCALHNDTSLNHQSNLTGKNGGQHIHIIACLTQAILKGELVKTSKDYEKGWPIMRAFEENHDLEKLASPGDIDDFGINYTKSQIKSNGSRTECIKNDWGAIIRAKIKNLYEVEGKPKTIEQFALGLARRNVCLEAVQDEDGSIRGINYQVLGFKKQGKITNSPLIGGSKIKGTRFTWPKLIRNETMSYKPERDNQYIGLAPAPLNLTASVKINSAQMRAIKMLGSRVKLKSRRPGFIDLSFCRTQDQINIALTIKAILDILSTLFSREHIEFYEYTIIKYDEQATDYDLFEDPLDISNKIKSDIQYVRWKELSGEDISGLEFSA